MQNCKLVYIASMKIHPKQENILFTVLLIAILVFLGGVVFRVLDIASAQQAFYALTRPSIEEEDLLPLSEREGGDSNTIIPDEPTEDSSEEESESTEDQENNNETTEDVATQAIEVSYWIYPGNPACNTYEELLTIENTAQLKPEFATIDENGDTQILTENEAGCNALSSTNIEFYKSKSDTQFITVSGSGEGFSNLVQNEQKSSESIALLVSLVEQTDFTGIELDFEGFSGWSDEDYAGYKAYLQTLGDALHENNRLLMIDAPAIYNDAIQSVFKFKYSDIDDLPVDIITIMAYDYQYDFGGGAPVTEDQFLVDAISRAKKEVSDINKLQIGLPTYGYTAVEGEYRISIKTRDQIFDVLAPDQIEQATRIPNSEEQIYIENSEVFVWQDAQSINHKIQIVQELGISDIAIWHLGGNPLVD